MCILFFQQNKDSPFPDPATADSNEPVDFADLDRVLARSRRSLLLESFTRLKGACQFQPSPSVITYYQRRVPEQAARMGLDVANGELLATSDELDMLLGVLRGNVKAFSPCYASHVGDVGACEVQPRLACPVSLILSCVWLATFRAD